MVQPPEGNELRRIPILLSTQIGHHVPEIISNPWEFTLRDLYIDLRPIAERRVFLKCEGFNFAGSIKLKAAVQLISNKERTGAVQPGSTIVESSSGNMGVALSTVAAARGYHFLCVTDSRCTQAARRQMSALGATLHVIDDLGEHDSYLAARLAHVRALCEAEPDYVWLNQYDNPDNWAAHYETTAQEIAKDFVDLDVLFVGAGTTGTLMGCARYFKENHPSVVIVAVDTVGSRTFGQPSGPRLIPGLGTTIRPGILDASYVDHVVYVTEPDTVRMCRRLARNGFLLGGSTGTVVHGALAWLADAGLPEDATAVAISPDLGNPYLDTIYDDGWTRASYGQHLTDASPSVLR